MTGTETANPSRSLQFDRLEEANHRIANQLAILVGLVQMRATKLAKGPQTLTRNEGVAILREIASKIISVGHLHRRLAAQSHSDSIDLGDYLIESCTHVVDSLSLGDRVCMVHRLDTDCSVTPEQAQQLGLLVSEMIMNAAEHAHPTGLPTEISVGCHHGRDNRIELTIADDGVGLPEGFDASSSGSTGFRLIRSIAASLDADLAIESDALGLSYRLLLPRSVRPTPLRVVADD